MEPIYIVLVINLIIWAGIFTYIMGTDKKIRELTKKVEQIDASREA